MATLDDLMEGKKPGEIKVSIRGIENSYWFRPYFKDRNGRWFGPGSDGNSNFFGATYDASIFEEPKPKKKITLYQWLVKEPDGDYLVTAHSTCERKAFPGDRVIARLDDSKLEIEVDDE